jgi:hypothetical protein
MLDISYYVEAVLETLGATTSLQKYRSLFPIPEGLDQLVETEFEIDRLHQCQLQYVAKLRELPVERKGS